MNFKRLWVIFVARNREFFRDKAAFGWNFLFPFLIVAGFGLIFGGEAYTKYKIGVFPIENAAHATGPLPEKIVLPAALKKSRYIEFIGFNSLAGGLEKLGHHKIDLLIENSDEAHRYWVNDAAPKGYAAEQIFIAALATSAHGQLAEKREIQGSRIRYIDWLFPGILAMNMMFSALWGVGYVVVRYRKNGVLKRLKATPLTAFEYLTAQLLSRIFLLMFTLVTVWIGCDLIFSFRVEGSYLNLLITFFVGSLSMSAMGLLVASRGTSEELTTGLLNFISWPMMFLSEVWFSLEGAPQWIKTVAKVFPLTHLITAARKIMSDGSGLADVAPELLILSLMTIAFLGAGAVLFSWNK